MNEQKRLKMTILFSISIVFILIIFILSSIKIAEYLSSKSEPTKEKKVYIEMDAVVSYSCKEYSVFSTAEFSNFVVFDEPFRDFYAPVILTIDTNNTSNTIDDEVIKVKDRDPEEINSTGGDIYEY